jgi:hypothetical protein
VAGDQARVVEELARDLDLLVFELERAAPDDVLKLQMERAVLRRNLERLKVRLDDLAEKLS